MLVTMMAVISSVLLLGLAAILTIYLRRTSVRPAADFTSGSSRPSAPAAGASRFSAAMDQAWKNTAGVSRALLIAVLFLVASALWGQGNIVPVCGDSCTPPDPNLNAPGVDVPGDRALPSNQRGLGNVFAATTQAGGTTIVQGSSSYTYKVPMYSLPGRAGLDLNLSLYYNSHIWVPDATGGMLLGFERDTPSPGFQLNFGFLEWNPSANGPAGILSTADGAKHTLSMDISNLVPNAPPPNNLFYSCANQICLYNSDDSSYINVARPLGTFSGAPCTGPTNCPAKDVTVTYKNGTVALYQSFAVVTNDIFDEFVMRPYRITDTNGNFITINYLNGNDLSISSITDSLGRTLTFFYTPVQVQLAPGQQFQTANLLNCITDGASCGAPGAKTYTFSWDQAHAVNFNFTLPGQMLFGGNLFPVTSGFTTPVLTKICRPDSTCVKFNYGDFAIVNDIQELSGNGTTVRYELTYDFPAASAGALSLNPTFTHQNEIINGQTNIWAYSATTDANGLLSSSSIIDPTGLVSTTTYSRNGDWQDGLPIQVQTLDLNAYHTQQACVPTPCPVQGLRTRKITWASDLSMAQSGITNGGTPTGKNPRPASTTTILEDNSQSMVTMQYDNSATPIAAGAPAPFTGSGSIVDKVETDFAPGAPGPKLRETITAYATLPNHILGLPADIKVLDGSGKVISHTTMAYDGVPVQNVSPVPSVGHDNIGYSAISAAPRGNLTSSTMYADPAANTGAVTTTYSYDMLGNRVSSHSGCCTQTAWNYSITTQYAYPDSVVVGPAGNQLSTSYTYFQNTGLVASSTDWNGKQTTFVYDVSGRLLSTQGPDGVTFSNNYDDSAANPTMKSSSNANSQVVSHTVDFKGRTLLDQILNGTSPVSAAAQINDAVGRPVQVSNPYGPSDTPIYTSYTYDLLGRVTQIAPPPATTGGTQAPYTASISGLVMVSTDPAGHAIKKYSNALGQIVRVDQPGLLGATAASGSLTLTGAEQSVASTSQSNGATAGTASVTIGGTTDRSVTLLTHAATGATTTVTVGGANGTVQTVSVVCTRTCRTFSHTGPDSGNMQYTVNVGGTVVTSGQVPYNSTATQASLAGALAAALPANAVVSASYVPGATTFSLTTKTTGVATNSSVFAGAIMSSCVPFDSDTTSTFCTQGWTMGGSAFSGGTDNGNTTFNDTGAVTVSITASGTTYTKQATYGQASTPNSIALDLFGQLNGDPAFSQVVRVTQPGTGGIASNAIGFTTVATGAGTNYGLTVSSVTTDTTHFTAGSTSFPITPSGPTFTPGLNGTLFDSGTITLKVNGFSSGTPPSKQVTYGQGSNAQGAAAQLAALVHADPSFPVDASNTPGSATISFSARAPGLDGNNYSLSLTGVSNQSASFTTPSFASPAANAQLTGGAAGASSFDPSVVVTTTYSYDSFGRILQVASGQQTQTYVYDGLGRLTSVATPESGGQPVLYTYTDFGSIAQRFDPRVLPGTTTPITTTYAYDSLNRVKTVTYNDGVTPGVTYTYNPPNSPNNTGGRLLSISSSVETKTYQYDVIGRVTQCLETIGANSYAVNYAYTPDGQLLSVTYPSQLKVNYSYDPIGRLTTVATATQTILSISPSDYNAAGMALKVTYGNNVTGTFGYNNRLQRSLIQYAAAAPATPLLSLTYSYGGSSDNGQITGITDNVVAARSTAYQYDPLGRLSIAQTVDQTSANTWKLSYGYDRYGNRLSQLPTGGTGSMPASITPTDPATNHVQGSGVIYDAAGNMVSDGLNNNVFDAENRLTVTNPVPGMGLSSSAYGYDPYGKLVNKNGTYYIYANGQPIAEYAGGAAAIAPTTEYIYVGGQQVARVAGGAAALIYRDHLSTRVIADLSGTPLRTNGHFPFGETAYETGQANDFKFTSYRRDANTGLDYADTRFYSSRLGRFMSMDQILNQNRYSYVTNNPINLVDPSGRDGGAPCSLDPFSNFSLPLCGPDQIGNGVGPSGASCGINFDDGGFTVSFASGCTSFSVDFSGGTSGPFGNIQSTLQDLLALALPIETCPAGSFECPTDGRRLFGDPSCGPWCVMDAQPALYSNPYGTANCLPVGVQGPRDGQCVDAVKLSDSSSPWGAQCPPSNAYNRIRTVQSISCSGNRAACDASLAYFKNYYRGQVNPQNNREGHYEVFDPPQSPWSTGAPSKVACQFIPIVYSGPTQ